MAIERADLGVYISCDECGEDFDESHDHDEFHQMIAAAKAEGWQIVQVRGDYEHYCPTCKVVREFT